MPTKKNNLLAIFCLLLISLFTYAHQADLSTLIISQTNDGKSILQINCSMSAFEGVIDYHYSKNGYKTPQDFKDLVIKHFEKNFSLSINGENLKFVNPMVVLGHETKLVVEILGVPKEVTSLYLKNTMFKDISHNQMAIIMVKNGLPTQQYSLPTQQYILNNENKQEINLVFQNGKWENVEKSYDFFEKSNLLFLLIIPAFYFIVKIRKQI